MTHKPLTVGIVGAGTMGSGIAEVAAIHGHAVLLFDVDPSAISRALARIKNDLQALAAKGKIDPTGIDAIASRIVGVTGLRELASTPLVIEAAAEDLAVKRSIVRELSAAAAPEMILASNTSSLSVGAIAEASSRPETVVGMHFFNPAPVMKLVEIVRGLLTSESTIAFARGFCQSLGKTTVVCRDTPGFVVNRVARHFYGEALKILGEGLCSVENVDRIMRESGGFRMGPFELMDLIGIDINLAVTQSVYEQFSLAPRFRPHPIQLQMVRAGTLGRKSGRGFYPYGPPDNRGSQ